MDSYTIVDISNESELAEGKIFDGAIEIPLNDLRDRADELPKENLLWCTVPADTDLLQEAAFLKTNLRIKKFLILVRLYRISNKKRKN